MKTILDKIVSSWEAEPAMYVAVINAGLIVAVSFGLPLSTDQKGAVDAFLAVVAGVAIRSQVVPVAKLPTPPTV